MLVRLAAFQGRSVGGDADANLATVHRIVDQAAEQRADFLCLPETFLSGYGSRATVERGAIAGDDPRLAELGAHAGQYRLVLLVGFSERLPDGRIGNSVAIFDGARRLGTYRKTMLTGGDYREMGFCTDFDLPVWQAKGFTFGCIVCADSSYFETAATMAYRGASVVFSPHFNRIPQQGMDAHRIRVRNNHIGLAALLDVYVVRANVVHSDDPRGLGYGDSAIFAPDGRPVAEAGLFREALIVADAHIAPDRATGRSRLRERVPHAVRRLLTAAMDAYPTDDW
jgi:predicted amidohydrolase